MNHPKPEEWAPYLFGEAEPEAARALKEHLNQCPECRQEIDGWKQNLARLDAWKLPATARRPRTAARPFLKLAAAAVVILAAGVGAGRLSSPAVNTQKLRAQIEPQIRDQLRTEFAQMLRDEMDKADTQRLADLMALKKDLDTVAVMTDAGLRRAQRQLIEMADYTSPEGTAASRPK